MVITTKDIFDSRSPSLVSSAQIRGARAMLGWSIPETAQAAKISVSVLANIERQNGNRALDMDKASLRMALEAAGVMFLDDDGEGAGLRLRSA